MLRHVVLFKWAPTFTPELQRRWMQGLDALQGAVPGLLSLSHGADILGASRSYDHAIVADFASLDALRGYDTHPLHEAIKPLSLPNVEAIHAVDFELPVPFEGAS